MHMRLDLSATGLYVQARLALEVIFDGVEGAEDIGKVESVGHGEDAIRICDAVKVTHRYRLAVQLLSQLCRSCIDTRNLQGL